MSITAGAHVVEPWAAIIAGLVGGWIFDAVCALFLKLRIDDPLAAAPMHGFCGAWGVFFTGLLASRSYVCEAYGRDCSPGSYIPRGLLYDGDGRLLASQVIGIISIFAWVFGLMLILFSILKAVKLLRISAEEEQAGLDVSKHGGSACEWTGCGQGRGVVWDLGSLLGTGVWRWVSWLCRVSQSAQSAFARRCVGCLSCVAWATCLGCAISVRAIDLVP